MTRRIAILLAIGAGVILAVAFGLLAILTGQSGQAPSSGFVSEVSKYEGLTEAQSSRVEIFREACLLDYPTEHFPSTCKEEVDRLVNDYRAKNNPETLVVVNDIIKINKGGYAVYTFNVPKDVWGSASLRGDYTSDGGGIKVLVANKIIFEKWKEEGIHFSGGQLYSSNNADRGLVDIEVYDKGETLYLWFDNTDDLDHDKEVSATFVLTYIRLKD